MSTDSEPPRPKMHSRLPSLDQLRERSKASSQLGNLPTVTTSNLPSTSALSSAPSPSTRLNRSLLSRKESISSIASIQEQPSSSDANSSVFSTTPTEGTTLTAAAAVEKDMGSKAPPRWKAIPTLGEIRERHMAAAAASAAAPEVIVEQEEGVKGEEMRVKGLGGVEGLRKKKGPLADLLMRKEVVLEELERPPPTPVPEFRVTKEEHPLGHTWTMTYSPPLVPPTATTLSTLSLDDPTAITPSVSNVYTSSLLHLGDFNTIESWARLSNHLASVPPSCLSRGGNYHLFKKGIEPVFEDPANANGGKWVLTLRGHRASTLDDAWRETILSLVGEALEPELSSTSSSSSEDGNEVCGAVVSVRAKSDRIQLWIKSKDPVLLVNGIGQRFVKALGLEGKSSEEGSFGLEFQYNQSSALPPPFAKYLTLSSSTGSGGGGRPNINGAGKGDAPWRTSSSSSAAGGVPLVVVGEGE